MSPASSCARAPAETGAEGVRAPSFDQVYDAHFQYLWRAVRRLGVDPCSVDDVVQDVFVVVHRRLAEFESRSTLRTWIYGIALRVVRDHRRTVRRKRLGAEHRADPEGLEAIPDSRGPHEALAKVEAARLLDSILDGLADDKREVFVFAELEGMTVPEIAEVTGTNPNTIYSRLRAARREFDDAARRLRAREGRDLRAPEGRDASKAGEPRGGVR
jgi:RNA polymerase sigma-70 factor (ECF subfamily)